MTHHILNVQVPTGVAYIDLGFEMSTTNHRLYRQGRVYHADVIATNTFAPGAAITVETIAPTWMNQKAWQLAFKKWRESTQHERDNGIQAGRWNDFRIYMEASHAGTPAVTNGEYQYTTAETADGSGIRTFQMFGNTTGSRFGVLDQYDDLRDTDTNTPAANSTNMPYSELLNELVNAQADRIQEEGDAPPYNAQNLAATKQVFHLQSPLGSNYYRTGMMAIPCGLIKVTNTGGGLIQVKLKPGKYKGVHAEAMA